VAKLYAYLITVNYREAYGMYAATAKSCSQPRKPARGKPSSTRKDQAVACADRCRPSIQCLFMGKPSTRCDWGHARDYVEMQWRNAAKQGTPED